jgi:hypothetical protein
MQSVPSGSPMQVPDTIVSTSFDGQPGPINTGSVPIFNEGSPTGYVSSPIVNPTVFGSSPEGTSVVSNFSGGDTFSYPSTANATQGTFSEVSGSWAPTATSQTITEGTPGGGIISAGGGWGTQVTSDSGPVGTPTQTVEVIPTTGVGSVNTSVPTFNSGGGTFESAPGGMQVNQSPAVSGDMISAFNSQTSNAWTVDNPGTSGGSTTSFFGSGGTVQADGGMGNNPSVVPVATTAFTAINEGGTNSVMPTYFGGNSTQTTSYGDITANTNAFGGNSTQTTSYGDITANTNAFGGNSTQTTSYGDITANTSAPVPQTISMPGSVDPTHTNNALQSNYSTYSNGVVASDNFSPVPKYLAYEPGGTVVDNSTQSFPMFSSNPPTTQEIPTMLNYGNNGVSQGAPPDVSNLTMIPNYVSNNQAPMVTEGGYAPAMPNTTEVVSNGYSGGGSYENITNSWFGTPSEPTRRVEVAGTSDLGMVPLIPNIVSHAPTAPQNTPTTAPSTRVAAIENPGSLSINPAKQPPRSVLARIIAGRTNQQNGTEVAANATRSNPANVARTGGNTPEELARYQPGGPDGDGPPPVMQAMPGSSLDQELLIANQRGGRIAKNDSEYEALIKAQLDEMTGISGMPDTGGSTSTV